MGIMKASKAVVLLVALTMGVQPVIWAQSDAALMKRIDDLEQTVAMLKQELMSRKAASGAQAVSAAAEESALTRFVKDVELHGFVDTSYTFNANTPSSRTNSFRIFDTEANSFMLNLAELSVEKSVSMDSPLGFRVDLAFGDDAEVFGSSGLGAGTDEFDLWQAYAQVMLPFSYPWLYEVDFKIGKFATLIGAEVIESKDNWNFSRSFLFGYAIPFNHTGVRMHAQPFEEHALDFTVGVVNGWDNVNDNNKGKSVEGQIAYAPMDILTFYVNGIIGPEMDDNSGDYRGVIDFILAYDVTDRLSLMANYDLGFEQDGAGEGKNAQWDGVAGYVKYSIFDWWSIAGRGEWFHDRDGVRTGVSTDGFPDVNFWEFTVTNEFKIYENLLFRVEFRHDGADEAVFAKDSGTAKYQNTVSGEVIVYF